MSEVIGIELDPDTLVLTRGRDFKWTFENVDPTDDTKTVDFPAGDLYFEIATHGEHNARQTIELVGCSNGSYKLWLEDDPSNQSPQIGYSSAAAVVQQNIEALPGVGAGNVSVTGTYIPEWVIVVNWSSALALDPGVVEVFNIALSGVFAALSFMQGIGVSLNGHYTATSYTMTVTSQGPLLEQEFINFAVSSVTGAIQQALGALAPFTGNIASITEVYAPIRQFSVEFVNGKALTPVAKLGVDGTSLVGIDQSITVNQLAPGRAPFTIWRFAVEGSTAALKVESEQADLILPRTSWQLVFLPEGETAGGDPVARGKVSVQE